MKETRIIMGMPITIEVVDAGISPAVIERVFSYFKNVDRVFSTYKPDSEISRINKGAIRGKNISYDMREVFALAEETKRCTNGYFDINNKGKIDPSGIVKGWAIKGAASILKSLDAKNFYIDCGGDIEVCGKNCLGEKWKVGIRNPFNADQIVKVLHLSDVGVATSGTYERGDHIYNPKGREMGEDVLSLTVIGPNVYEADRFATAGFVMGKKGISFIESLKGFEGYMIDKEQIATYTSGFANLTWES